MTRQMTRYLKILTKIWRSMWQRAEIRRNLRLLMKQWLLQLLLQGLAGIKQQLQQQQGWGFKAQMILPQAVMHRYAILSCSCGSFSWQEQLIPTVFTHLQPPPVCLAARGIRLCIHLIDTTIQLRVTTALPLLC
jgi:hypothetical protein